ncbi:MAG: type II toxin-antitoxin system HipA family toxin [Hyphomicrobiales bacterium]|nr:type II toxin-antitoxin system HipA family toxin [Hyphomicrobiales bacterium]
MDGFAGPIGVLVRDENGILSFTYHQNYILNPASINLSLSMPMHETPYKDAQCHAFFGNLLQESDDTMQPIMDREGIERDDIAGFLLHLGKDCPGAISVLASGAPPAKVPGNFAADYEVLDAAYIEQIVIALHEREPLPDNVEDPSPIAGVQSKIALTILPDGSFAQSKKGIRRPNNSYFESFQ